MSKMVEMNKLQRLAFDCFITHVCCGCLEVKEVVSKDMGDSVFFSVTIGLTNDGGSTMLWTTRTNYMFFVGKRGGIYQYRGDRRHRTYCKYYELRPTEF